MSDSPTNRGGNDDERVKPSGNNTGGDAEENDSDEEEDGDFEDGGSEEEGEGDDDDRDGSDDGRSLLKSPLKKKRKNASPSGSESKAKVPKKEKEGKTKKNKFIDDEAAESGDEEEDDDDGRDGDEEQQNTYVYDDFVVADTEGREEDELNKGKKKKREFSRLKKRTADVTLEEEDLLLIEDNLRAEYDGRDDGDSDKEEQEDEDGFIAPEEVAAPPKGRNTSRGYYDEDEEGSMDNFIIDDGLDQEEEEEEDELEGRGRKRPQAQRVKKASKGGQRRKRSGPTSDQIDEVTAMFGEDYGDFDEDEDEEGEGEGEDGDAAGGGRGKAKGAAVDPAEAQSKLTAKIRSKYERSQLVESFCTDRDDIIRLTDRPERFQDIMDGRTAPSDEERAEEAAWMASKLAEKIIADSLLESNQSLEDMQRLRNFESHSVLEAALKEPLEEVLKFLQIQQLEVPFIWTYRRDYLHAQMTRKHLWMIFAWDEKWDKLYSMKKRLTETLQSVNDAAESLGSGDDSIQREERAREMKRLRAERFTQLRHVKNSDEDLKLALDNVDSKDDEATADDREQVELATEALEAAAAKLADIEANLSRAVDVSILMRRKRIMSSKYRPEAAIEASRLFPKQQYQAMIDNAREEQDVRDLSNFLALLLRGAEVIHGDRKADEELEETDPEMKASLDALKGSSRHIIRMGRNEYKRCRGIPRLRTFAETFSLPACEFGDAIRHGYKAEPPATPPYTTEEAALSYVDDKYLKKPEDVLKAVSVLLANELCLEPSIRHTAKIQYKEKATVSTRPTAKGLLAINPFSEMFGIQHLDRKPLSEFYVGKDRTLFLRLLEAEKNGLLVVTVDPPMMQTSTGWEKDPSPFLMGARFAMQMLPSLPNSEDPYPDARSTWDTLRMSILEACIERHLVPSLELDARRELVRIGRDAIIEEAGDNFSAMLAVGPYRIPSENSHTAIKELLKACPFRPAYYSVACIVLGQGTREALYMAYVDKLGVLRAQKLLPDKAMSQKKEVIRQFICDHRPDIIILNSSGGQNTLNTAQMLTAEIVPEVSEMIRNRARANREMREERSLFMSHRNDDDENIQYTANVVIIKDEISQIFRSSTRAKRTFPEFEPGIAAAICLARYVQEPLAEYCAMWKSANAVELFGFEALYLNVHPLKHLLGNVKYPLLCALEHCLVDAVCEVGVDLTLAVQNDHLSSMLAFVGGLGLRKAEALKQSIRRKTSAIAGRNELFEKRLLGSVVWTNCIGFLRIADSISEQQLDPLDNTRIHPECYIAHDFAPKICADALEVDANAAVYIDNVLKLMRSSHRELEKKLAKSPEWVDLWEHGRPSGTYKVRMRDSFDVRTLSVELSDSLSLLELGEYAEDLIKTGRGKRRLQLEHIKEELRYPWLDLRKSIQAPSESEMFTTITGENDYTLHVGLKMGCIVVTLIDEVRQGKRMQRAYVRTDGGLRGSISVYDIVDEMIDVDIFNLADYLQVGMHVSAVVVGVSKQRFSVDLSVKPSHLRSTEDYWMSSRLPDTSFNNDGRNRFNANGMPAVDKYAMRWWEQTKRPLKTLFDPYFKEADALKEFRDAELTSLNRVEETNASLVAREDAINSAVAASALNAGGSTSRGRASSKMRQIHHPLFANTSYKEAEDRLRREGKGPGEVLFRPSSKGPDILSITWAFRDNWYKHFDVEERGKRPGQTGLAPQLFVKEVLPSEIRGKNVSDFSECFSDLDEVTARYIQPMNDYVQEIVSHSHFCEGSPEDVTEDMRRQLDANPNTIQYRLRVERNVNGCTFGCFVLTWMGKSKGTEKAVVRGELVVVKPTGLKFGQGKELFTSVMSLINFFKTAVSKRKDPAPAPQSVPAIPTPASDNRNYRNTSNTPATTRTENSNNNNGSKSSADNVIQNNGNALVSVKRVSRFAPVEDAASQAAKNEDSFNSLLKKLKDRGGDRDMGGVGQGDEYGQVYQRDAKGGDGRGRGGGGGGVDNDTDMELDTPYGYSQSAPLPSSHGIPPPPMPPALTHRGDYN